MSADKLVFDISQEVEGTPNVFVKKDWLLCFVLSKYSPTLAYNYPTPTNL